jgi:hypothetical protein
MVNISGLHKSVYAKVRDNDQNKITAKSLNQNINQLEDGELEKKGHTEPGISESKPQLLTSATTKSPLVSE